MLVIVNAAKEAQMDVEFITLIEGYWGSGSIGELEDWLRQCAAAADFDGPRNEIRSLA